MRAYARLLGEDEERWAATGILHDLDYERYPDLATGHPRVAVEELRRRGYPEDVIEAIEGHAEYLGVPRRTPLARALYAVDELSGFVAACARVRPDGIHGLTPKSVKKKLKAPSFAAGVDREGVRRGA
ncbi:MAG: HDIG domain-containing protein, partial [Thermoleophilaceae bacterium]|nr:HDIG domain-containing protein [Thermoleophilaceae bacterium]